MLPTGDQLELSEHIVNQIEDDLNAHNFPAPYNKEITHDIFGLIGMLLFSIGQNKPNYDGPYSHLLGYFEPVQDDEIQDDEQILLQLHPEPSQYEETWGDMGTLFYSIKKKDLQHKNFAHSLVSMHSY